MFKSKIILLTVVLTVLFSCKPKEEDTRIPILKATIEGKEIVFKGKLTAVCYQDVEEEKDVAYEYLFQNSGEPSIVINMHDNTLTKQDFSYPDIEVRYYTYDENDNAVRYDSNTSGKGYFKIIEEKEGYIYADFEFSMISAIDKKTVITIKNGRVELPLRRLDRR